MNALVLGVVVVVAVPSLAIGAVRVAVWVIRWAQRNRGAAAESLTGLYTGSQFSTRSWLGDVFDRWNGDAHLAHDHGDLSQGHHDSGGGHHDVSHQSDSYDTSGGVDGGHHG